MQIASFGEPRAKIGEIDIAEFVVRRDRQFERGTFQMIYQDFQIVGLDKGALRCVAEEIVRMANDELIQRRRRSHQHGAGTPASSSRAAGALPRSGDGAGISGHHYNIERADVNAELQRAGRARFRVVRWANSHRDSREWYPACPATADLPVANRSKGFPCAAANWRRPWFADHASEIPIRRARLH